MVAHWVRVLAHICSAEMDPRKIAWIRKICGEDLQELYKDLKDIARAEARNVIDNAARRPPARQNMNYFFCGFSCKSASGLNSDKDLGASCITSRTGTTGSTFDSTCAILLARKPLGFLLENVEGLLRSGEAHVAAAALRACGYELCIRSSSPLEWGVPQSRPRIWFYGWRSDVVSSAKWSAESLCNRLGTILEAFLTKPGFKMMSLDKFLFPEDHVIVHDRRTSVLQKYGAGLLKPNVAMSGEVSLRRKRSMDREQVTLSSAWSERLVSEFPTYLQLAERERHLLDATGTEFPEVCRVVSGHSGEVVGELVPRMSNVSQSSISSGRGWLIRNLQFPIPRRFVVFVHLEKQMGYIQTDSARNAFSMMEWCESSWNRQRSGQLVFAALPHI